MNILVKNDDTIKHQGSVYLIYDNSVVVADDNKLSFVFGDLNSSNCSVKEIDTAIEDFEGDRFLFVNNEVIENPDWGSIEDLMREEE